MLVSALSLKCVNTNPSLKIVIAIKKVFCLKLRRCHKIQTNNNTKKKKIKEKKTYYYQKSLTLLLVVFVSVWRLGIKPIPALISAGNLVGKQVLRTQYSERMGRLQQKHYNRHHHCEEQKHWIQANVRKNSSGFPSKCFVKNFV